MSISFSLFKNPFDCLWQVIDKTAYLFDDLEYFEKFKKSVMLDFEKYYYSDLYFMLSLFQVEFIQICFYTKYKEINKESLLIDFTELFILYQTKDINLYNETVMTIYNIITNPDKTNMDNMIDKLFKKHNLIPLDL
jgi:hypothetical protein